MTNGNAVLGMADQMIVVEMAVLMVEMLVAALVQSMVALKVDRLADEMDEKSDVLMALKKSEQKGQLMVVMTVDVKKDQRMEQQKDNPR